MNKKGFTLIELVVVVTVIAILAVVAVPAVSGIVQRSRESSDKAQVALIQGAIERYNADKGSYPSDRSGVITAVEDYTNIEVEVVNDQKYLPAPQQANKHFYYNNVTHKVSVKGQSDTGDIQLDKDTSGN